MKISVRDIPPRSTWALEQSGVHPLLARLYASRGVKSSSELDSNLSQLLAPNSLFGTENAAVLLANAIEKNLRLCIVADYDCDGATACSVGIRGLRLLGAKNVSYLVPDRVLDGYGLTAPISERVHAQGADVLITVDNGISSVEGVDRAHELNMQVLITDHHSAGAQLPNADVIVNPNQPNCTFQSKSIAGVGVMFYVLLALRSELRKRGVFNVQNQPKLDVLLPLVALGTVADVVALDANNRRLVAQGLKRIRAGNMQKGIEALFKVSSRKAAQATTFDFGFALGPRINAAGRLDDMRIGIECLLTDDANLATELAHRLDNINRERREIEDGMRDQALYLAEQQVLDSLRLEPNLIDKSQHLPPALCVLGDDFHEGVIGIVASRLKDKFHRPIFVFATSQSADKAHEIKGSGRSIPGFHLRDALDLLSKRHEGVLLRFGGHAMAAGCTVAKDQFDVFEKAFRQIAQEQLDKATLTRKIETDGALPLEYCRVELVDLLHQEVWGQGFAPPTFSEEMDVLTQTLVGEKHLKLKLRYQGQLMDGIWFNHSKQLPSRVKLAFRLDVNEWQNTKRVQFLIEGAEMEESF